MPDSPHQSTRSLATRAAAEFTAAARAQDPTAGLAALHLVNSAYRPPGVLDMLKAVLLELHRTCAAEFRTAYGSPDLGRLVPDAASANDVLAAAADRARAAGTIPDASDIAAIELPLLATASLRPTSQEFLDATARGHDGTAGAAAENRLTSLAHTDVVIAFPLLAAAIRVTSSSADLGDSLRGS